MPKDPSNPLLYWREEKGWTQEEAATRCNVSRQLWTAWESRTRPMSMRQALVLLKVFGKSKGDGGAALLTFAGLPLLRRPADLRAAAQPV